MRAPSLTGALLAAGFTNTTRASTLLQDQALAGLEWGQEELVAALAASPDPDQSLLGLVRLAEDPTARAGLPALDELPLLLRVVGASTALTDQLLRHPQDIEILRPGGPQLEDLIARIEGGVADVLAGRPENVATMPGGDSGADVAPAASPAQAAPSQATWQAAPGAVDYAPALPRGGEEGEGADGNVVHREENAAGGPDGAKQAVDAQAVALSTVALRRAYRRALLAVVGVDLSCPQPDAALADVAALLARLADAALAGALRLAQAHLDPAGSLRMAIIAFGKTGARELNYVSDVDVMYVVAPREGEMTQAHTELGSQIAGMVARICGATGSEPELWTVDANLRPEGKDGVLVRTIDSYARYYRKWAQSWEFQALLKARPVAGDAELGEQFLALTGPLVWEAAGREGFVESARAMRSRVESLLPAKQVQRELKLAPGGLRDVEFTVQLLQLVHGRSDARVRQTDTLGALSALAEHGYIGRAPAAEMGAHYRMLRLLEHRTQLLRLRRTHLLPEKEAELRRVARGIDLQWGAQSVEELWGATRARVRKLHEEIFYRPLLPATAQLSPADLSLEEKAAHARLAAIGYRDPRGALGHIRALTEGYSRRAVIQRQLIPVMLGWFGSCVDPDQGLLAFRRLSEAAGDQPWYLRLLRDSSVAASQLCQVLGTSPYVADAMPRLPEAVQWLDDETLSVRTPAQLDEEVAAVVSHHEDPVKAITAVRAIRRRELTRAALIDVLQGIEPHRAAAIVTPVLDAVVRGAFSIALREVAAPVARHAVVAMGRFGGNESGYASDADVCHVYDALPGASEEAAQAEGIALATRMRELLGMSVDEPVVVMDAALRPEGKNGPLARSLASYREYYGAWAEPWEFQALLRARPVAGDVELGREFEALIDPLRYRPEGLGEEARISIKRLKARMESERLPRAVRPARHVKLGPGGLSDVEWTVQLMQLDYGAAEPGLRTTSTLPALAAARAGGHLSEEDAAVLSAAWEHATKVRAARVLGTGRTSGTKLDVLPDTAQELAVLARLLGYASGQEHAAVEDYLRDARRARAVYE
ncbi:MAG: bifunctional [glutamine synthetase] adenylyltransferase/[glutamine synthetase]-adenylyl-L-tyrosine phosphorylase, partial [Buchananella hordeovulneris]|nr:bifunctional [glutamine synthetase] adenylyltransferase/[glutamine synthetase]-adenylyl-L-tyrosine phosphorylase [Buchananella hordeovulneris]